MMKGIEEHFGHPSHLPRAGHPSEIGPVIAFVASRRNSYMTGANINVDGGSDFYMSAPRKWSIFFAAMLVQAAMVGTRSTS
jgi:hypothetical protein